MSDDTMKKLSRFGEIVLAMTSPLASRKVWMTIVGVSIIYVIYRDSVMLLWSFSTDKSIEAFTTFYKMAMGCITVCVMWGLGVQTTQSVVQNFLEKKTPDENGQ